MPVELISNNTRWWVPINKDAKPLQASMKRLSSGWGPVIFEGSNPGSERGEQSLAEREEDRDFENNLSPENSTPETGLTGGLLQLLSD